MTGPQRGAPSDLPDRPAWRSPGAWVLLGVVALGGLVIDLATKSAAFASIAAEPVVIDRGAVVELTSQGRGLEALLPFHEPRGAIPHLLEFQLVLNKGAVFGLGAGKRWVFVAFTLLAVTVGLWAFGRWTHARDRLAHVSIGLVLGGGLGNVYDRLVFACVRDFIHPLPGVRLPFGLHWPNDPTGEVWPWVSNVADLFLILGVAGLMLSMWRTPRASADAVAPPGAG
ncbi:MAG: signal peptidase II [Phycisphaerales bacterium]|nr:signal peptidase II [Phycisphaerales bacterium]